MDNVHEHIEQALERGVLVQEPDVGEHVLGVLPPEPEQALVEVAAVLLAAAVLADVAEVEDDLEAGEAVLRPGGLQQLSQPSNLYTAGEL